MEKSGTTQRRRRRWQPWQVIALSAAGIVALVGLVSAVVIGVGLYRFGNGDDAGPEAQASAQAVMDQGSPDFPIEVTDVRTHSFMADTWQSWHLRARETGDTYEVSVHPGDDPTRSAREHFKIARDGEKGTRPSNRVLPADLPIVAESSHVNATGPDPRVDFSTRDPYDHDARPIQVHAEVAGRRMTSAADDAAIVNRIAAWAAAEKVTLDNVELWHQDQEDGNLYADTFTVRGEALAATDLAQRLTQAKAAGGGREVRGVAYRQVGSLPGTGDPTPAGGDAPAPTWS